MNFLTRWQQGDGEVSVAGMGRSGLAAAKLLLHHHIPVYLSDQAGGPSFQEAVTLLQQEYPAAQISPEYGGHDLSRIARSQALILSPGIAPETPPVLAALEAAVPVLAEAQLGLDAMRDVAVVAITGTNGKTTTTALVNHLFREAGRSCEAAGNFGLPLCEVALRREHPQWVAAELSSFQLHDMPELQPAVGILTNLSPDHLDRYRDVASYYADKAKLFVNANAGSIWVTNLDDTASREMVRKVPGRHLTFTVEAGRQADGWYDRRRDTLILAGQRLINRNELYLLGDHNVGNALAASLALYASGVDIPALGRALSRFRPLKHRLEPVREVNGVLWINDSKATNVASTEMAIRSMIRPYVLLLGGKYKGEPYSPLIDTLKPACVAVVAYGASRDLIVRDLGGIVPVVQADDFEDVVMTANRLVPPGGVVLLSPACSSFDMFANYEERGARFRQLVEQL